MVVAFLNLLDSTDASIGMLRVLLRRMADGTPLPRADLSRLHAEACDVQTKIRQERATMLAMVTCRRS